ncbi:MAG: DMT family transporter [Eubacteriales bacterium]|jgi:drug/metabolite transporter (DMT)-like permease
MSSTATQTTEQGNNSVKIRHSLYLLLAAFFWGTTFVAQSVAMDDLGPYTYNMCRCFVGALVLLPLAIYTGRIDPLAVNYRGADIPDVSRSHGERWKSLLTGGIVVGLCMFMAGGLQQVGLVYTTAGKSGFVTALYIVLVPIFSLIFFRKKCSPLVWLAVVLAVVGFFLLCIQSGFTINKGDLITLGGSVFWALHILSVDHFVQKTNGIQLSCVQLVMSGICSGVVMVLFETPTWHSVIACAGPILYAGIFSSGVAFTLQIVGQKGINPTTASLLMSLESVISVISGWLVLGDALTGREILGCVLVFAGVILAQLPDPAVRKKAVQ